MPFPLSNVLWRWLVLQSAKSYHFVQVDLVNAIIHLDNDISARHLTLAWKVHQQWRVLKVLKGSNKLSSFCFHSIHPFSQEQCIGAGLQYIGAPKFYFKDSGKKWRGRVHSCTYFNQIEKYSFCWGKFYFKGLAWWFAKSAQMVFFVLFLLLIAFPLIPSPDPGCLLR